MQEVLSKKDIVTLIEEKVTFSYFEKFLQLKKGSRRLLFLKIPIKMLQRYSNLEESYFYNKKIFQVIEKRCTHVFQIPIINDNVCYAIDANIIKIIDTNTLKLEVCHHYAPLVGYNKDERGIECFDAKEYFTFFQKGIYPPLSFLQSVDAVVIKKGQNLFPVVMVKKVKKYSNDKKK